MKVIVFGDGGEGRLTSESWRRPPYPSHPAKLYRRTSFPGLVTQFVSAMLHVEEVVYSIETYVKLKAWVKEIDVKELADLVVKIVAE